MKIIILIITAIIVAVIIGTQFDDSMSVFPDIIQLAAVIFIYMLIIKIFLPLKKKLK